MKRPRQTGAAARNRKKSEDEEDSGTGSLFDVVKSGKASLQVGDTVLMTKVERYTSKVIVKFICYKSVKA